MANCLAQVFYYEFGKNQRGQEKSKGSGLFDGSVEISFGQQVVETSDSSACSDRS